MFSISNPCPVKWENMTPASGGSYCDQCCKVVMDFTQCSNEEIIRFLSENSSKRTCGRFRAEQVARPKPRYRLARIAAALLVAFGGFLFSSCNTHEDRHVMGDTIYMPDSATRAQQVMNQKTDSLRADSISKANAH